MRQKGKFWFFLVLGGLVFLLVPILTYGAGIDSKLFQDLKGIFGGDPNSPTQATDLGKLITVIIQILLIVAASVAVIFLMWGGYKYVIARGNEEATEAAKKTITSSIWGLVIIVMAYAIVTIIAAVLLKGVPGTGI